MGSSETNVILMFTVQGTRSGNSGVVGARYTDTSRLILPTNADERALIGVMHDDGRPRWPLR